jgi:hypothetical protein
VSRVSVACKFTDDEEDVRDRVLIDFRVGLARQALHRARFRLQRLLIRLNARPGTGMNFALVYEIARAEQEVVEARGALISVEPAAMGQTVQP